MKQNIFKRFWPQLFLAVFILYLAFSYYSFLINFAIDEGNIVTKREQIIASMFPILLYPAWLVLPKDGLALYLAIPLNSAFYGLLVERLWHLLIGHRRSPKV